MEITKKECFHLNDVLGTKDLSDNIQDNENLTSENSDEWAEL